MLAGPGKSRTSCVWHCQVDVEQAGSTPDEAMTHSSASDAGHLSPDTESPCSQEPMMDGPQEVAADTKEIRDGAVHREKPLRVGSRFEPAHLTLPAAGLSSADSVTRRVNLTMPPSIHSANAEIERHDLLAVARVEGRPDQGRHGPGGRVEDVGLGQDLHSLWRQPQ